jgi:serine phosphatase RsbU (regulator of sigma subunit)
VTGSDQEVSVDYGRAFDAVPVPVLLLGPDLVVVAVNRAWLEDAGTTRSRAVGQPVPALFPAYQEGPGADDASALRSALERSRDTGRAATVHIRSSGTFARLRIVPVADDAGGVAHLLLHRADDSVPRRELERVEAELQSLDERHQRTAQVLAGLASTVSALAGAQSRAELLQQLFLHGRHALRADTLAVALAEPGGSHLAVVHSRDPADGPPGRLALRSTLPMAVAAGGRPVFEADAEQGGGATAAPMLGLRAWAALPLRVGPRPLGSLTVGWERPHAFGDDDVSVLEAFATQCSQAVHRVARLEAERRQAHATRGLAETLQRALLTAPPRMEHLDIAVRYRPAAREAEVGGDWYDAFRSPSGPVVLVVGDVTGHDWTSAAIAGQLRNMLRGIAFALEPAGPVDVLAALDRALRDTGMTTLATAVVARVEPAAGAPGLHTFRWSNAGHPPPLLIRPDGTAALLDRPPNVLLGVAPDRSREHHAVALPPGATVLLYTDGLVERRNASLDDGLGRLRAAGSALAGRPVDELCDELLDRLHPDLTDDIALLAVRVRDGTA